MASLYDKLKEENTRTIYQYLENKREYTQQEAVQLSMFVDNVGCMASQLSKNKYLKLSEDNLKLSENDYLSKEKIEKLNSIGMLLGEGKYVENGYFKKSPKEIARILSDHEKKLESTLAKIYIN